MKWIIRTVIVLFVGAFVWVALSVAFMWEPITRPIGSTNVCVNSLRQIDAAKVQWALQVGATNGSPVAVNGVNRYFKNGMPPVCPGGGTYTYNPIGERPVCSKRDTNNGVLVKTRISLFTWCPDWNGNHELK